MNVNIFLKQFKCSHKEIIEMLEEGDVTKIGPERLRGLKKILPYKDEVYNIIIIHVVTRKSLRKVTSLR